ncbi:MAG TPA: hypothetical protein VFU94_02385 [Conexibacter sp.]|nr:hypothetical protein [Conexibacter sp.]
MSRPLASRPSPRAALAGLLAAAAALLALAAPAARAGLFAGIPVAGPTPALHALDGLDLAPDGTGAIAYTMDDGGVQHAFVNRLVNGAWGPPERLDADLASAGTQVSVAAGDGGRLLVVFVNGGNVYADTRASAGVGWSRQTLWSGGGASDPNVDLSVNGKGYAVFATPGAGGHDVRAAYEHDAGPWTVIGPPLDADPADDAGTGAARPRVAASADGVAIAVWGEAGHVFARRIWRTSPSVVVADALAGLALEGVQAAAADLPVVSTQDDDSFTGVALRATFDLGGGTLRTRAVFRRLRGSRFETPYAVDGATFASGQGSTAPAIATVGTGNGLVVAGNDTTNATSALPLLGDVQPAPLLPIDTLVANGGPGYGVPGAATPRKMLVAWQVTPPGGAPELHARYRDGGDFGAEQAVSQPQYGGSDAANGLLAAGDDTGDIAVAYEQDVPGQGPAIMFAAVDQPPGAFVARRLTGFQRTAHPALSWTTSLEAWGRYFRVTIDGAPAGVTGGLRFRPPAALAQGVHTWQATAFDRRGQSFAAAASTVKVDSVAPYALARLSGVRQAGTRLKLSIKALDTPTGTAVPQPGVATSGVRQIVVDWGDRTARQSILHGAAHAYRRAGRYRLRIVVVDGAGNRTALSAPLRIAKAPKGKARRRGRTPVLVLRSQPPASQLAGRVRHAARAER